MRYGKIDLLRAIAVLCMIVFHFWYTLTNAFWVRSLGNEFLWEIIGRGSALTFLVLAGFSFALAEKKYPDTIIEKYLVSSIKIGFFALLITIGSYLLFPHMYIRFGILHYFAAAFILLLVFRHFWYLNIVFAFVLLLLPQFITFQAQDSTWLIFGFMPPNFNTLDYFPLIPFFGVSLLGYVLGLLCIEKSWMKYFALNSKSQLLKPILWIGKNSLLVYVVHLPFVYIIPYLFFLILWLV